MPSQTIHISEDAYAYILQTKGESFSERASELIDKGIEAEQ